MTNETAGTGNPAENWLIRRASGEIEGPHGLEWVKARIASGDLEAQDEVCQANQFWITLGEGDELWKQLQIRLPRKDAGEEVTQSVDGSDSTRKVEVLPEPRQASPTSEPFVGANQTGIGVESPSIWRGIAWILITGAAVSLYVVLKILRSD